MKIKKKRKEKKSPWINWLTNKPLQKSRRNTVWTIFPNEYYLLIIYFWFFDFIAAQQKGVKRKTKNPVSYYTDIVQPVEELHLIACPANGREQRTAIPYTPVIYTHTYIYTRVASPSGGSILVNILYVYASARLVGTREAIRAVFLAPFPLPYVRRTSLLMTTSAQPLDNVHVCANPFSQGVLL